MMNYPVSEGCQPRMATSGDLRLYFLDHGGDRVLSAMSDGSDLTILVNGHCAGPDGIAIDAARGHVYWTNMGVPSRNDGFIMRCDLDGHHVTSIVPPGLTHTPKQLVIEAIGGHLYWCDREGMRVMRCKLDGSSIETLVQTGFGASDQADARNWCVGIAVDVDRGHVYWTQKGASKSNTGRILRAPLNGLKSSESPASRRDIETLFSALPEPVDLELDTATMTLYWTDRGAPPFGNTLNRACLDASELQREVLHGGFREAIGLSVHPKRNAVFLSDLNGSIYRVALGGQTVSTVLRDIGNLTGITAL
ncbi:MULTISPECIES: YncE family protein [Paraburkholderia]|jgi:DNA-binding beta-propeller fold protein YncE|uniref:YncE family protein n=1 Tax=Paraburkholderia TaxID=1822464 RepID=UPI0038BCE69C